MSDDVVTPAGAYAVPLHDIQGNVTPGFNRDFQDFIFLRFPEDQQQTRAWLNELRTDITNSQTVANDRANYRVLRAAGDASAIKAFEDAQAVWFNVAFTHAGLQLLDPVGLTDLALEFRQGLMQRLVKLKLWDEDVNRWSVRDGITTNEEIVLAEPEEETLNQGVTHAVVIIGANTSAQLQNAVTTQIQRAEAHGLTEVESFHGTSLMNRREHLGFVDGISQPDPRDLLAGWLPDPSHQRVAPGEFILGCAPEPRPASMLTPPDPLPDFAMHGSYVAMLRIHQDVDGFWSAVEAEAERLRTTRNMLSMNRDLLAAKIVGRWPSGALLTEITSDREDDPGARDPGVPDGTPMPELTKAYFDDDRMGYVCPVSSHIRRAFPRVNDDAHLETDTRIHDEPRFHRIIRRSITYQDGARRGLIFVAYQASLANGFEKIQSDWLAHDGRIEDEQLASVPNVPDAVVIRAARWWQWIADARNAALRKAARSPFLNKVAQFIGLTWVEAGDLLNVLPETPVAPAPESESRVSRIFYKIPADGRGYEAVTIPVHTTVKGGGYFFAPSLFGLQILAGGVAPS